MYVSCTSFEPICRLRLSIYCQKIKFDAYFVANWKHFVDKLLKNKNKSKLVEPEVDVNSRRRRW